MRILALFPVALVMTGCLAPGERDPTRYPWDEPQPPTPPAPHPPIVARGLVPPIANPVPPTVLPEGNYCVVALEQGANSGIVVGGNAPGIQLACSAPAAPNAPPAEPSH